jgi:hypothetical protein
MEMEMRKEVIEHLEKDAKTWQELSDKALEEHVSDMILINKIKEVKKVV